MDVAAIARPNEGAGPGMCRYRSWHRMETLVGVLARDATCEVMALVPSARMALGGRQLSRIGCATALARGAVVRLIHESDDGDAASVRVITELVGAGAETRLVDRVPRGLFLVDSSVALILPGSVGDVGLLVHEPAVVESMSNLFRDVWRQARVPSHHELVDDDGRDREVLRLMSRGVTDVSAARSLAVSLRTYRRCIADLMLRLGASTRFQAGALAAERGWLE